jgi:tetratricopeptide (TPR) repeat protein
MFIRRKRKISLIFSVLFLIALFLLEACFPNEKEDGTAKNRFAGTASCISCHEPEYQDWLMSDHDLAMMRADSQSVLGDFKNTVFSEDGMTSTFFKKGQDYLVNTEGPDGVTKDFKIEYTFGVRPLQQYLVKTDKGKYQTLRTTWDTEKKVWFHQYESMQIPHDDWLHWSKGGQNWNSMCADCHSTNVHKNYFENTDSFNTSYSIIDVSCEACHGPSPEHVHYMNARKNQDLPPGYDGRMHGLLLTKLDTSQQQVDQCARCHSRRAQVTAYYDFTGTFYDHYIPDILRDNIYFPDGQIMDEDYVYGSFVQSKMYHNHVKCTDCHNAHSLKLKVEGNILCLNCHVKEDYDTPEHHFHEMETEAALCISCHMTGRIYMGNDFRRDHSFRIPRPDQSVNYNTPNACSECHDDKSNQWAADAVVEWYGQERAYHFSDALTWGSTRSHEAVPSLIALIENTEQPDIARATAIWYLGQIGTQEAVQTILNQLNDPAPTIKIESMNALMNVQMPDLVQWIPPLLRDSVRGVRITAANTLADVDERLLGSYAGDFKTALQEYETYLQINAEFPAGQIIKGQYHERRAESDLAEIAYKRAIKKDKLAHLANLNLATLYNRQGRQKEALEALKMILALEPGHGQANYSLALLYAELDRIKDAARHMEEAANQMPDNPRVYYNWGLLLQNQGLQSEAEQVFNRGLKRIPESIDIKYALCILWIQNKQFDKAKPMASQLIEQYPDNPTFRELMNYLQ